METGQENEPRKLTIEEKAMLAFVALILLFVASSLIRFDLTTTATIFAVIVWAIMIRQIVQKKKTSRLVLVAPEHPEAQGEMTHWSRIEEDDVQ